MPALPLSPKISTRSSARRGFYSLSLIGWLYEKRNGSLKLSSLCKGGDYLLFRFRSTIGVMRFNFSVRDGKRWNPHAVFTLISLFFGSLFPEPFFRPWPALRPYGVVGETGTYRSCRLPSRLSGRKLSSVVPTSRLRHGVFCFFSYGTFGQLVPLG